MSLISLSESFRTLNGDKKNVDNIIQLIITNLKARYILELSYLHRIKLSQYKDISLSRFIIKKCR